MYINTQTTKVVTTSAPSTFTSFLILPHHCFLCPGDFMVETWSHNDFMVIETHEFTKGSYPTMDQ